MTGPNRGASVRARLRNLARRDGVDFGAVLTRYGIERMLYRLNLGDNRGSFLLKGALLFDVWFDTPARPTRDVDLLALGPVDVERVEAAVREACQREVADGLTFFPGTVSTVDIRRTAGYPGVRVTAQGDLDGARIHVQLDVAFGDAVTPGPEVIAFPVLLEGMPPPVLHAYPKETAIAEKLEAVVRLGRVNSRIKDHFDLWILLVLDGADPRDIAPAVAATFARRETTIPMSVPSGLSQEYAQDPRVLAQWRAFISRNRLAAPELADVLGQVREVALPLLALARALRD